MPLGPGKYDDLATLVREKSNAEAVILSVIGGTRGNGFSVQVTRLDIAIKLPDLLRDMADQIEANLKQGRI